jgi:hypothetical protein
MAENPKKHHLNIFRPYTCFSLPNTFPCSKISMKENTAKANENNRNIIARLNKFLIIIITTIL